MNHLRKLLLWLNSVFNVNFRYSKNNDVSTTNERNNVRTANILLLQLDVEEKL